LQGDKYFARGIIINENLERYIPILKSIIEGKDYKRYGNKALIKRNELVISNIDNEVLKEALVAPPDPEDISHSQGTPVKEFNIFKLIRKYLCDLEQKSRTGKRVFDGMELFIPKALTLTSPMALFDDLEIILESIKQKLDEEILVSNLTST
jgi:hypothetical protein